MARAACLRVVALMAEADVATLRLVAPHLRMMADAWEPRGDRHALNLCATAGMCLAALGEGEEARGYLARAGLLEAAL